MTCDHCGLKYRSDCCCDIDSILRRIIDLEIQNNGLLDLCHQIKEQIEKMKKDESSTPSI